MNKKIKVISIILSTVMVVSSFSGCSSIGLNDTELLRPPRATGEKAEIQNVIDNTVGTDYTLQYPKKGDYHSAIITEDLNGDGNEEAMVIYRTNAETTTTNLLFLNEAGGQWKAVRSFTNKNFDIDKVFITDIDGDGVKEIIVGWSSFIGETSQVTYYKYSLDDMEQNVIDTTYSDMATGDLTGSGTDDLILLSPTTEQNKTAIVRLYSFVNENGTSQLKMVGSTYTNPNVIKYTNVEIGKIDNNNLALFLDGTTANEQLLSEVIYFDKASGALIDPLNVKNHQDITTNSTSRQTVAVCRDIDHDNIMEIPQEMVMEGSVPENSTETLCNLNRWFKMDVTTSQLMPVAYTVASYADGYYFLLPKSWENNVTATSDTATRTMKFYQLDRSQQITEPPTVPATEDSTTETSPAPETITSQPATTGDLIMTIQVFTEKDWAAVSQNKSSEGYYLATKMYGYVYTLKLADNIPAEYAISNNDVANLIKII